MISNEINVDSCLIRIPIDYVEVNENSGILDKWSDYNEDTHEIRRKKRKTKRLTVPGIGYDYCYSLQNKPVDNVMQHFLYLTIYSKMNKEKYFEGVTLDNIHEIYKDIIAQKVVYFDFDALLYHSLCTDVEFKMDFLQDQESYADLLKGLKAATPPAKSQKGYKPYHMGVEWNTRSNATPARPYVKIYDKHTELKKPENREFTKTFLRGVDTTNLRRIEFQVKNKKHFDSFQLYDRSLWGVLNLTQETKRALLRKVMGKVVDSFALPKKKTHKPLILTPAQQFMKNCLQAQLRTGVNLEEAINVMTASMNSNNTDKYKKKLNALYSDLLLEETEALGQRKQATNLLVFLQSQEVEFT